MLTAISFVIGTVLLYWGVAGIIGAAAQTMRHLLKGSKAAAARNFPETLEELVAAPFGPAYDAYLQVAHLVEEISILVGRPLFKDSEAAEEIKRRTREQVAEIVHAISSMEIDVPIDPRLRATAQRLAKEEAAAAAASQEPAKPTQAS